MIKIICQDEQDTIWNVPSQSSNETYVVAIDENGKLFCSCPDFTFRKAHQHPHLGDKNNYCKTFKGGFRKNENRSAKSYS